MNVESSKAREALCDSCQRLDFHKILMQLDLQPWTEASDNLEEEDPNCWRYLGYLDIIAKHRDCAFCGLIVQSLHATSQAQDLASGDIWNTKTLNEGRSRCFLGIQAAGIKGSPKGKEYKSITLHVKTDTLSVGSGGPYLGEIKLVADDAISIGVNPLYQGRLLKQCVDLNLIHNWIKNCRENHTAECEYTPWEKSREFPQKMRLIDVKRMCIIQAPNHARYVALSYVWGSGKISQLTMQNVISMEKESSLSKRTDILGQTLLDAMELVKRLEERYLWCDQLCILQDDEKEKITQIGQMGLIYAQATLTIIAAGGSDSDSPLPGLRPGSRTVAQRTEVVNGLRFVVPLPNLSRQLDVSTWNTRAWAFQERLLSRRALIFTKGQVHFDCRCDSMREDVVCERLPSDQNQSQSIDRYAHDSGGLVLFSKATSLSGRIDHGVSKSSPKAWPNTLMSYSQLIESYSSKHLSYPQDILLAFEGAQAILKKSNSWSFSHGLPEEIWDHALLWRPRGTIGRRVIGDKGDKGQPLCLPTYSWAAWIGPVTYRPWDFGLVSKIDQFEIRRNHLLKVIKRKRQIDSSEPRNIAYEYNPPIHSKPTAPRNFRDSIVAPSHDILRGPNQQLLTQPLEWLQFWAFTVPLSILKPILERPSDEFSNPTCKVSTTANAQLQTVDVGPRIRICSQNHCKMCFLWNLPFLRGRDDTRELVLLSQSAVEDPWSNAGSQQTGNLGHPKGCTLNLMLVQWREGFAERITIGRMHESVWKAAAPKRKLIKLI